MKCKWYHVCPMRRLERKGKIGDEWKRRYCTGAFTECERYRQEERGIPHPDTLLPDGTYLNE